MPEFSLTIKFENAEQLAKWLEGHTFPSHSNANVNPTTGEVGGSASASASSGNGQGDPWDDFDASPANDVATANSNSGPHKVVFNTQKGAQTWTFNSGNAPMCGCGIPAAFQEGSTNNKPWKRWTCSRGAPDGSDNWKNKCDFSEFSGGKRGK